MATAPALPSSSNSIVTRVTAQTFDQTVWSANGMRVDGIVYNESTQVAYVLLGRGAASSTNYTFQVASQVATAIGSLWKGEVHVAWASASGAAQFTEFLP